MEYRRKEIGAGVLMLTAVILLVSMVTLSSSVQDIFRPKKKCYVRFERVEGIEKSSPVKQAGRLIGKVSEIKVSAQDDNKIILSLGVFRDTVVKRNSEISIKSPLVGERYIDVGLGTRNSPPLKEEDIIDGKESLKLDQLTDTVVAMVEDIKKITADVSNITGDPGFKRDITKTLNNLRETTNDISGIVQRSGPDIDGVFGDLKNVSTDLNNATTQLNKMVRDINRIVAENRANIHSTIRNFRDTPDQIVEQVEGVKTSVTAPIEDNRDDIQKIVENLKLVTQNVNELIQNVEKITNNVDKATVNLDKVTQNIEKITQNLVELTEELKEKPYKIIRKE